MPTVDSIAPLHQLSFAESTPDGVVGVAVSPGGQTALVHIRTMVVDPGAVIDEYRGGVLNAVLVLALAIVVWRAMRIRARPQRPGVMHCRRCNYDLSGSGATDGAASPIQASPVQASEAPAGTPPKCPECGTVLDARTMVPARSTARRIVPLGVVAAAVVAVTIVLHSLSVPHWPSLRAQRAAESLGIVVPDSFAIQVSKVLEIDLATGSRVRTVLPCVPAFWGFELSPSGDAIVTRYGNYPLFVQYSTADASEVRRVGFHYVPMDEARSICGFSGDGSSVYLRVSASEKANTAQIVRWSLVDGSTSVAAEVPVQAKATGNWTGTLYVARPALVIAGTPNIIVAGPTTLEGMDGQYRMITIHTGPGSPTGSIFVPLSVGPIVDIAVQPGGSVGGSLVYVSGKTGLFVADARTQAPVGEFPLPPRSIGRYGSGLSADASGRLVCPPEANMGSLPIYAVDAPAPLASLDVPAPLLMGDGVTFSPGARYAVGIGWPRGGVPPGAKLMIWDLLSMSSTAAPSAPPSTPTPTPTP